MQGDSYKCPKPPAAARCRRVAATGHPRLLRVTLAVAWWVFGCADPQHPPSAGQATADAAPDVGGPTNKPDASGPGDIGNSAKADQGDLDATVDDGSDAPAKGDAAVSDNEGGGDQGCEAGPCSDGDGENDLVDATPGIDAAAEPGDVSDPPPDLDIDGAGPPQCDVLCTDAPDAVSATDAALLADAGDAGAQGEVNPADGDSSAPEVNADVADVSPTDAGAPGQPIMPVVLPEAAFTDATTAYGINPDKVHGACVATADFDANGREDFAVVELSGTKARIHTVLLFDGPAKHVFTDIDTTVLVPNFGCSAVDMTADGKADLLMGGFSGAGLYVGNGQGGFADATTAWMPFINDSVTFSIVPVDLDGDLDLDVFVGAGFSPPPCESLKCQWTPTDLLCIVVPPLKLTPQLQDRVLIQGAKLPLVDATAEWNVPPGGTQTVVLPFDVDADGKMDLLVGDDFGTHRVLHNLGGTFKAYETEVGFHSFAGSMGWTVGDLDGNGAIEFVLAESGPTPVYEMVAKKPGTPMTVKDRGGEFGIWWPTWGASAWTPIVADLDHDGHDDLYLGITANFTPEMAADFINLCETSKVGQTANPFQDVTSLDVLFTHAPGGGFVAHKLPAGQHPHVVMIDQKVIDLDGDGDLDLVQTRPGPSVVPTSRVRIMRNDLEKKGGSAVVLLQGKGKNTDAIGAVVRGKVGGQWRTRWLGGAASFAGMPTRRAHFGLGSAAAVTDVEVTWPGGAKTVVGSVAAGGVKVVVQP